MADVERRVDGSWIATDPGSGRRLVAHAVTDASGAVWVAIDGEVVVHAAPGRAGGRAVSVGPGGLDAPMPAQVTAVLVEPGDEVTAGSPLVLLDAMKMELPVRAPFDGRVRAVHCAAGDRVTPGHTLVDLDRSEATA